jgi:hypothetical protein
VNNQIEQVAPSTSQNVMKSSTRQDFNLENGDHDFLFTEDEFDDYVNTKNQHINLSKPIKNATVSETVASYLPIDLDDLENHYAKQIEELHEKFLYQKKINEDLTNENNHLVCLGNAKVDRLDEVYNVNEMLEKEKDHLTEMNKEYKARIVQAEFYHNKCHELEATLNIERQNHQKSQDELVRKYEDLKKKVDEHGPCYREPEVISIFDEKHRVMVSSLNELKADNMKLNEVNSAVEEARRFYQDKFMALGLELENRNNKSFSEEIKGKSLVGEKQNLDLKFEVSRN